MGAFWTAVVVDVAGRRQCGLASTPHDESHHQGRGPAVGDAGHLAVHSARDLAGLARSESLMQAAIGMAAVNATTLSFFSACSIIASANARVQLFPLLCRAVTFPLSTVKGAGL